MSEKKHPINDFSESTVQKIKDMIDVNTIVGTPITTADGTMVIPVSKVSLGFLSSGADWGQNPGKETFGCATGTGVTINPVAFLIVKDGSVKLIPVNPPAGSTVDRVIDIVPDVLDKATEWFSKDKE